MQILGNLAGMNGNAAAQGGAAETGQPAMPGAFMRKLEGALDGAEFATNPPFAVPRAAVAGARPAAMLWESGDALLSVSADLPQNPDMPAAASSLDISILNLHLGDDLSPAALNAPNSFQAHSNAGALPSEMASEPILEDPAPDLPEEGSLSPSLDAPHETGRAAKADGSVAVGFGASQKEMPQSADQPQPMPLVADKTDPALDVAPDIVVAAPIAPAQNALHETPPDSAARQHPRADPTAEVLAANPALRAKAQSTLSVPPLSGVAAPLAPSPAMAETPSISARVTRAKIASETALTPAQPNLATGNAASNLAVPPVAMGAEMLKTPNSAIESASVATAPLATAPAAAPLPAAPQIAAQPQMQALPMQMPDWPEGLVSGPISALLDAAGGSMVLDITPEELGRMTISLTVQGDSATVRILTETPEAARLLMEAERQLASELARFGMSLAGHDASADRRGPGQQGGIIRTAGHVGADLGDAAILAPVASRLVNLIA